jgi:hypothetical protein
MPALKNPRREVVRTSARAGQNATKAHKEADHKPSHVMANQGKAATVISNKSSATKRQWRQETTLW